jgi:hypothetical protein
MVALLAPLFLLGAIAVAVPVILHLTQRSKGEVVEFPSFMFLQRIPSRTTRHRRIRDPLLLALRVLALLLLTLAFARPLIRAWGLGEEVGEAPRDVVILVDRSFSMRHGDRWERARREAEAVLDGVRPGERAALVQFAKTADAGSGLVEDVTPLRSSLATASPGDAGTSYGAAFRLAGRLLGAAEGRRREVVLISDFQRTGWDEGDDARLPGNTEVIPLDVASDAAGEASNLTVADLDLRRTRSGEVPRLQVAARILNLGADSVRTLVELEIGGRLQADTTVSIPPGIGRSVAFDPVPLPRGGARGGVHLASRPEDDGLPLDDEFRFVLEPDRDLDVLVLQSDGAPATRSLFLREALSLSSEPGMRVTVLGARGAGADRFAAADVIVLNDVAAPDGAAGAALFRRVEEGAGLVVVAGARVNGSTWPGAWVDPLPGVLADVADRSRGSGGSLTTVDGDHPVFEVFRAPRSGDLAAPRVYRYRRLDPSPGAEVVARFDDGSPALVESRHGDGRVLLWATSLDRSWSDFPVQPVYLPLVQRIVMHAAAFGAEPAWREVGEDLMLDAEADGLDLQVTEPEDVSWIVEAPSGERESIHAGPDGTAAARLDEAGFWRIRLDGMPEAEARTVAVNPGVSESDLRAIDHAELVAAVSPTEDPTATALASAVASPADRERRQGGWRFLMAAAGLVLVVEAALANRRRGYGVPTEGQAKE